MARVDDESAVAIVDAGAGARRRYQPGKDWRDLFRIDGKYRALVGLIERRQALAGLQVKQLVGIDGDGVGVDRGGGGDGAGDYLSLGEQTRHACVDEAGAELVEEENAADENDEREEIEDDDAPRQAGEDVESDEARRRGGDTAEQAGARRPRLPFRQHRALFDAGRHGSDPSDQSSLKR